MNTRFRECIACLAALCSLAATPSSYSQRGDYDTLKNRASAEYSQGRFETAETLLRQALEISESTGNTYEIAKTHRDLGRTYQEQDRLYEGQQAFTRALVIFRQLPDKQYDVALTLLHLGMTYSIGGSYSKATKLLNEAANLNKKETTRKRVLAAQILNVQSVVLLRRGKLKEAEAFLNQALAMRPAAGPNADLNEAQIHGNLGAVYQRQQKYERAEASYNRALEITEQRLGSSHPDLSLVLGDLGSLYTDMKRYGDAEAQYRRALTVLEPLSPFLDARIVRTLLALSKTYVKAGKRKSAEETLSRALDISRRNPKAESAPGVLDAYAELLKSTGRPHEAQSMRAEARRIRAAAALAVRVP